MTAAQGPRPAGWTGRAGASSARFPPGASGAGILFAEDFDCPEGAGHGPDGADDDAERREPEVIVPSFSAEELAQARADAFREGEQAGRAAACADDDARSAASVGEIARALQDAATVAAAAAAAAADMLARLLLAGFAAVAPDLCARHGEHEAAAVLRIVLPALRTEPRITVRVAATLEAGIRARLADLDPEVLARIEMVPQAMAPGDVHVSWRNGEAVRDTAGILARIGAALAPLELPPLLPAVTQTTLEANDAI